MSNRNLLFVLNGLGIFALSPGYKRLIIKNNESEAVKIARHLQEMLLIAEKTALLDGPLCHGYRPARRCHYSPAPFSRVPVQIMTDHPVPAGRPWPARPFQPV